jgi:hypothetical protein
MAESLLKRSKAKSIMDRSRVRKDEYVELSAEGLPEKEIELEEKPKHRGILHRTKSGIIHWATESPEEHKFLHAMAEGLRHKMSIEGLTPAERIASMETHIEHGFRAIGEGIVEGAKRKKWEFGGVPSPEAVVPTEEVERAEVPTSVLPSEEILVCRKARKLEAVV